MGSVHFLISFKLGGILENTLLIITSDHGELFGEHGLVPHGNKLVYAVIARPSSSNLLLPAF